MPQNSKMKAGSSGHMKRKNAPAKRKGATHFDPKSTKNLNKSLEARAAAKTLRNESKFKFALSELNDTGKKTLTEAQNEKERKRIKKRTAADRQIASVEEKVQKRAKNDLE